MVETTLENFGERKLKSLFPVDGSPLLIPIGHSIENRATLEEIIKVAKIAAEERAQRKSASTGD